MAFYDPAMTSLPRFFPKIESYADALRALRQRGLLVNGYLHTEQISVLAESDPIVDYLGWQHLESELLVYLAANLLVSESRGAGWLKSPRDNDTTNVVGAFSHLCYRIEVLVVDDREDVLIAAVIIRAVELTPLQRPLKDISAVGFGDLA